jgi:nucleotidyltransferase substrate binding protein (TIGR01987 family)
MQHDITQYVACVRNEDPEERTMDSTAERPDARWAPCFGNYRKALAQLRMAVLLSRERTLSELEELGLIQVFEFTHELACRVIEGYCEHQGSTRVTGARDATREALRRGLLVDGEAWMAMIRTRSSAVHSYDAETAREIVQAVTATYYGLLNRFEERMLESAGGR